MMRSWPESCDLIQMHWTGSCDQQIDVITRRQALAAGVTASALRHRLRTGGPWRTLLPGVYIALTGTPTTLQQEMAAMLYAGSGSVITGPAALRCHHIRGPSAELVDILVPATRKRRDAAFVRLHRTTRMPERIWQAGPLRYAPPARAVADAVRDMTSLRDVRAVVADAVQRGRCGVRDLARRTHRRAERRVRLVPRGTDGRRRRDQVGRRGGPEGPAGQVRAAHAAVQPVGVRRRYLHRQTRRLVARAWRGGRGGFARIPHVPRGSRQDACPGQADGRGPDRHAQVHAQADPLRAGGGHRYDPAHTRRRPRPPAAEPAHRAGHASEAVRCQRSRAGQRSWSAQSRGLRSEWGRCRGWR